MNDSWKKKEKQLGDLAVNCNEEKDDMVNQTKGGVEKGAINAINGSHQKEKLEIEPILARVLDQTKAVGAINLPEDNNLYSLLPKSAAPIQFNTLEDSHDESSNSTHGLDSIVQDSICPLQEKSLESGNPNRQVQPRENQIGENLEQKQEKGLEQEQNSEKVNLGTKIKFWKHKWLGDETLQAVFPGLSILYTQKEAMVVDMVDDQNQDFWKFHFRRVLYDWQREQLQNLVQLLSGITLYH
ncbi:hypothetical protein RHGRI_017606 [Rhododendron griersonianum]|uniref:Uncharacterized protein n=1 Tax=Rhododendron griersonianum TaxID=479676 RepID=A0AAV6JYM8_9ERIC|nr:hypothetical protein RHGRI_017606 [Rhododendron griersonianum]